MTEVRHDERFRQPMVKRLGLEDGWWFFCPHFLNLGLPLVFVDTCLLPEAEQLALEPFGARRPDSALPSADLRVRLLGNSVRIYAAGRRPHLVNYHWFREPKLPQSFHGSEIGIVVGDSYALQLTWSALWTCRIGTAAMDRASLD